MTEQRTLDFEHRYSHCGEEPVGVPYAKGSDTSRDAATAVQKRVRLQRAEVLDCIRGAREYGRTWDEIVGVLDCSPTANGRITELRDGGDIVDSGRRRLTRRGSPAVVWIAREFAGGRS
ncbi:MAG: hypothetical protein WA208_11590 [Thermoanaerobaculia bacterium]